jgi:TRAP-type C4-dicarboxylate transport system substrate-binding protein
MPRGFSEAGKEFRGQGRAPLKVNERARSARGVPGFFLRFLLLALLVAVLAPAQIVIKMGTLAPEGSPWHKTLLQLGDRWRTISGGTVKLVIYAGGVLGDEPDLVKKMRIGQIQAVALSGVGMYEIERGAMCLQIPMMFESYEELDYVRDRVAPKLEKTIEAKGFIVLNWGDAGWVHFFSTRPVKRLSDMRQLKLFTWAGDNDELELWQANGFRAVPLAATDILTGLQTGLIEAVPTTPLYALLNQSFGLAPYMNNVRWAPLIGATVITRAAWERMPADKRAAMLQAAREAGYAMRGSIRKMGDDAVVAMQKRKLTVVQADAATIADWRREAENVYPKIRGRMVPADMFDQVRALRDEYRARAQKAK